jgi:hydrogenase maturation protein HypF
VAHLEPVPLPGGERAIKEPWRTAASYLERAERPVPFERWPAVRESLKVNAPLSSGVGRLFDAVAALLGVREDVSYEGQAAIELERSPRHRGQALRVPDRGRSDPRLRPGRRRL